MISRIVHCPEDKFSKFFHLQTGVVGLPLKPEQKDLQQDIAGHRPTKKACNQTDVKYLFNTICLGDILVACGNDNHLQAQAESPKYSLIVKG